MRENIENKIEKLCASRNTEWIEALEGAKKLFLRLWFNSSNLSLYVTWSYGYMVT